MPAGLLSEVSTHFGSLAHEFRAPVVILDEFSAVVRVRRLYSGKP